MIPAPFCLMCQENGYFSSNLEFPPKHGEIMPVWFRSLDGIQCILPNSALFSGMVILLDVPESGYF